MRDRVSTPITRALNLLTYAAEHEATVTAISIGRELLRNGSERALTVEVHDDQGQRVTEVTR